MLVFATAAMPITVRNRHMSTVGRHEWIVNNTVHQWCVCLLHCLHCRYLYSTNPPRIQHVYAINCYANAHVDIAIMIMLILMLGIAQESKGNRHCSRGHVERALVPHCHHTCWRDCNPNEPNLDGRPECRSKRAFSQPGV